MCKEEEYGGRVARFVMYMKINRHVLVITRHRDSWSFASALQMLSKCE